MRDMCRHNLPGALSPQVAPEHQDCSGDESPDKEPANSASEFKVMPSQAPVALLKARRLHSIAICSELYQE